MQVVGRVNRYAVVVAYGAIRPSELADNQLAIHRRFWAWILISKGKKEEVT